MPTLNSLTLNAILYFFYPPDCMACGTSTAESGRLCAQCFEQCDFIKGHLCECCGYPLHNEYDEEISHVNRCIPCISKPPSYTLRSALTYDDFSKELILKLKYFDRMDLAKLLAGFIYQVTHPYLNDIDVLVPVPLHWKRLWQRRYNQATEIAHGLSSLILERTQQKIPVLPNVLQRVKPTESQGFKSHRQRIQNIQGAFWVRKPELLQGNRVAIIDDVYTSGATIKGCAKALQKAGVSDIVAFTVARVIKGEELRAT